MNDQELRYAIEQCKYNVEDGDEDIRILVACAEAVLAAGEKLPEKKVIELQFPLEPISGAKNIQHLAYRMNNARNQTIDDCRAVIAKSYVPKEEYEKVKAENEELKNQNSEQLKLGREFVEKYENEGQKSFDFECKNKKLEQEISIIRADRDLRVKALNDARIKIDELECTLRHNLFIVIALRMQMAQGKLTVEEVGFLIFKERFADEKIAKIRWDNPDRYSEKQKRLDLDTAQAIVAAQEKRGK